MRGTVRVTFRLPYNTDDAEHYEVEIDTEPLNHEELLVAMAKFDVENFPETLENLDYMTIDFDGWSE